MNLRRTVIAVSAGLSAVIGVTTSVAAQSELSGPTVALDRYELTPGERVKLTIAGFEADYVNMVFCGNEGRRGSVDCNVRGTQARETEDNGAPTAAEMPVTAPPVPCPCIIRVSSEENQEIAVAPVTLVGHPVAEVVGNSPADIPLTVDIVANAAPNGLSKQLRLSLGGATTYDVTVRVRNSATFDIDSVAMASTFTRTRYDDVRAIDFPDPGPLAAGQTWEQTVQVQVPALTFGDVEWTATASGQGPSVSSTDTTSSFPTLLVLFGLILVVDLLVLLWRWIARARRRRAPSDPQDNPFVNDPDGSGSGGLSVSDAEWPTADWSAPETSAPVTVRTPQLVP